MKKQIISILLCVVTGFQASAEGYVPYDRQANEISASYGILSVPSLVMAFGGIIGTGITGGLAVIDDIESSGSFSLGYYRYLNNHIAVGCELGYEKLVLTMKTRSGEDASGSPVYKSGDKDWIHVATIMPGAKFPWFNFKNCGLYSKVNIGLSIHNNNDSSDSANEEQQDDDPAAPVGFAVQLTPFGVDFGGDLFRGFVEAGFGFQGMIVGGVRFAF